jgi:hypothetical protein
LTIQIAIWIGQHPLQVTTYQHFRFDHTMLPFRASSPGGSNFFKHPLLPATSESKPWDGMSGPASNFLKRDTAHLFLFFNSSSALPKPNRIFLIVRIESLNKK